MDGRRSSSVVTMHETTFAVAKFRVVMAVAALHFYLSPVADLPKVVRALVFAGTVSPRFNTSS